jgi:hypothetical protein
MEMSFSLCGTQDSGTINARSGDTGGGGQGVCRQAVSAASSAARSSTRDESATMNKPEGHMFARSKSQAVVMMTLACGLTLARPSAEMPGSVHQDARPVTAVPQPPIAGLVDAFRDHAIVAVTEGAGHGDLRGHDFRVSLVRDPRFTETVNDIVVEFGNARYQDVIDRFVAGEDISYDVLRQVWQNTTAASALWDAPIYEEFFRTVRDVNRSLPRARRLRVLLGDPPIEWADVHTPQDIVRWGADRDRHPAQVVEREVLAKHRRALLIYGGGHLWRKTEPAPDQPDGQFPTLVRLLERSGARVFTVSMAMADVGTLQPGAASWPVPSLVLLRGTPLGLAKFRFFAPAPAALREVDPLRDLLMQDQFDALIYTGPPAPLPVSRLSPTLCADPGYMKMRLARLQLTTSILPPGGPSPVDQLKQYCASVAQR